MLNPNPLDDRIEEMPTYYSQGNLANGQALTTEDRLVAMDAEKGLT